MKMDSCRMCLGKNLSLFLDLGSTPPSDAFLREEDLNSPEPSYPLNVYLCEDCGQAQLGFTVPPEILYQRNYPYESSTTRTGREHFSNMARSIVKRFSLNSNDLAIDVGSNVGVLLEGFRDAGTKILGIDPASDMVKIANEKGLESIPDFFAPAIADRVVNTYGQASVITGTNVFAHVNNLDDFMTAVKKILKPGGVLVIEAPHFLDLVKNLEYDTIYHEHLSYLSVKPMAQFFKRQGFELFDVEKYPIHGGSLRYFVSQSGTHVVSENVDNLIQEETKEGIHSPARLKEFALGVADQKKRLTELLHQLHTEGKTVVGVSAPAKGNTLLNYCGITPSDLSYITEKAKIKIGLYTPGTHIPIKSDESLIKDRPDYALILAWNFAPEIMSNLEDFRAAGGKFIIPIPVPKIEG